MTEALQRYSELEPITSASSCAECYAILGVLHCDTAMTQQIIVQGREMRKYSMPAAQARRSAGITADYLEAVEAESDYEDDGLTASDRARRSLLSRDRLDEQAEVRTYAACLITCIRAVLYQLYRNNQSQDAVQLQYTQESMWPHDWYHTQQHQACFSMMMSFILTEVFAVL